MAASDKKPLYSPYLTRYEKFDEYFWTGSDGVRYHLKGHRHLNHAPWVPHGYILTGWRIIGCIFLLWLTLATFKLSDLAFFTYWGIYLCTFCSILFLVHEFRSLCQKRKYT